MGGFVGLSAASSTDALRAGVRGHRTTRGSITVLSPSASLASYPHVLSTTSSSSAVCVATRRRRLHHQNQNVAFGGERSRSHLPSSGGCNRRRGALTASCSDASEGWRRGNNGGGSVKTRHHRSLFFVFSSSSSPSASRVMGKKARLTCSGCGASFKQKGGSDKGSRFCGATCAAVGADDHYGDIPPAFAGAALAGSRGGGGSGGGGGYGSDRGSDYSASSFSWEREAGGDGGGGGVGNNHGKGGGSKKRKKKKVKKQQTSSLQHRPVASDPQCLAVMTLLDDRCEVIASPGPRLDAAVAKCASEPVIAVDCEGVSMSRVGLVTLLQVAAGDDIFLFDVQALGGVLFQACGDGDGDGDGEGDGGGGIDGGGEDGKQPQGLLLKGDGAREDKTLKKTTKEKKNDEDVEEEEEADVEEVGVGPALGIHGGGGGGGGARRRSLKAVLEDPAVTKLMFDCRVDSDALFHQHGIRLEGVFDVQLADVAARRRNLHAVNLLSGMPKCAARHLPGGASAAEASLAALDGPAAFAGRGGLGFVAVPPPDAASVARVAEHLKKKVKELYAPDLGGHAQLWALRPLADDVRRYAALDAWLLREIHDAMLHAQALDEGWTKRVREASAARTAEYRDLTVPVLQFRDVERAAAPDF